MLSNWFRFSRHLYTDMERVSRVWEVELQAVLEIGRVGHRKRILHSVAGQLLSPPLINEINESDVGSINLQLKLTQCFTFRKI